MMDNNAIMMDTQSLDKKLSIGSIVWGKLGSYKWWPGIMIKSSDGGLPNAKFGYAWVFWFGDHKVSQMSRKRIVEFTSNFKQMYCKGSGKILQRAVNEALEVLAIRFNHHVCTDDLLAWAIKGFTISNKALIPNNDIPAPVQKHLDYIQILNNKLLGHNDEQMASIQAAEEAFISNAKYKGIKEGLLKIEDVCVACFGNEVEVVAYHPLFEGGLCLQCKERLQENIFALGNDGKNICCVVCANPGSLILCDNINCSRSYCFDCIALLLGPEAQEQILQTTPWLCFFCRNYNSNECGLLRMKCDWEERLLLLFQTTTAHVKEISILDYKTKKPIKVLSLFDGISTGKVALDNLGIVIDKYYSSEIDEDAINVSRLHHMDSVIRIGDVTHLTEEKIQSICPIDLVIGGSPCNELSLVNPTRKGIYDFSGTGPLFFEFFHILKTVERLNGKRHAFFLYENVAAMSQRDKAVITSFLMEEPVLIDAKIFSPQSRPRYFWGNIPGMNMIQNYTKAVLSDSLNNDGYECDKLLSHCLLKGFERKAMVEKIRTVTTQKNSLIQEHFNLMPVKMNGEPDVLWVTELEKIFGFPLHYTDTGYLGVTKRRELLGRAWSVPVVKNILRPLLNFFKNNDVL